MPSTEHNPRYHAVASRLPRLPRELVHEVFNDLSIQKILEILCNHNSPYLDECTTSHFKIGKLIPVEALPELKEYFTLYLSLCALGKADPHPHIAGLEHDAAYFLKLIKDRKKPADFNLLTKVAVIKKLELYAPFLPVLSLFVDGPDASQGIPGRVYWDTSSPEELRKIFELVDAAEVKLWAQKADQLSRFADLLERYPNYIRTCCEKDETVRDQKHRIAYLRRQQAKMPAREILRNQFIARVVFAQKQFYLVPFDRVLRGFLKVLQRYPPAKLTDWKGPLDDEEGASSEKIKQKKPSNRPHHTYPEQLKLVLDGFSTYYARSPSEEGGELPARVINTKYSLPGLKAHGGGTQPEFFIFHDHPTPRAMKKWEGILPFPEKEFVWLEAFLSLCEYMSGMQEEWSTGRSVANYWKTHVGGPLVG